MKVPYFFPWITTEDKKSVLNSLEQRWLTNGPNLKKFEDGIKKFIQTKYASGVGSATHALHLSVRSLGIHAHDEVIVPTFTFAASANCVTYCNAKPILVDVDPKTFNISPKMIEKKITKKTKAIIVVHYGGQSCDMSEIISIVKKYDLYLIEDCAHALGSVYKNKKCGSFGHTGCFSFYPTKIITTGEGGMITTNNSKLFEKIKILKSQGLNILPTDREKSSKWRYDIIDLGYNYRMDEIRASLGLSQLKRINKINQMRIKIGKTYDSLLKKIKGITIPYVESNRNHIYHLYTIKIDRDYHLTRDELFQKLNKVGIGSSVQFYPLHLMSYNKGKYRKSDFPIANKLKDQVLSLPIFPTMTTKQIEYVCKQLI